MLNRLLSGIIAKARADAKVNAQAAILSEVAAMRMDVNMQKADETVNATVRVEQPSPENVSNEGEQLAQGNESVIMNEGAQGEAGNGAGDMDVPEGRLTITEETFAIGSKIPDDVIKTKPLYSPDANKWIDNGGKITVKNGIWKYADAQGISVTYKNSYPDFKGSGHVKQEVDIGSFSSHAADFRLADMLAPNGPINPDNTWHHNEDGRTLQEVDKNIHRNFTHRGGISVMKKNLGVEENDN